ncbi:hypothetical protein DNTS_020368 [Danionella cerebrum]|uniref:Uncharacterized protein n=1 Tax=Danionella cerebrum TaxID=2873325 RepID=A0A553Q6V8_9TELE|nr:hypothetical protein DNTS_020368 [Danionella translucida]
MIWYDVAGLKRRKTEHIHDVRGNKGSLVIGTITALAGPGEVSTERSFGENISLFHCILLACLPEWGFGENI